MRSDAGNVGPAGELDQPGAGPAAAEASPSSLTGFALPQDIPGITARTSLKPLRLAEAVIPAADLSEQISTAGMEASGTGNIKLALNGALTIGTLDGANIEISERVGAENMFIFGLEAFEVAAARSKGLDASDHIAASDALAQAIAAIEDGVFSPDDRGRYEALVKALRHRDFFMVCADFTAYFETQRKVETLRRDPARWWQAAILNTARVGWFSSDRSIREYARMLWGLPAWSQP